MRKGKQEDESKNKSGSIKEKGGMAGIVAAAKVLYSSH
jgi:hypothetical protein